MQQRVSQLKGPSLVGLLFQMPWSAVLQSTWALDAIGLWPTLRLTLWPPLRCPISHDLWPVRTLMATIQSPCCPLPNSFTKSCYWSDSYWPLLISHICGHYTTYTYMTVDISYIYIIKLDLYSNKIYYIAYIFIFICSMNEEKVMIKTKQQ